MRLRPSGTKTLLGGNNFKVFTYAIDMMENMPLHERRRPVTVRLLKRELGSGKLFFTKYWTTTAYQVMKSVDRGWFLQVAGDISETS